MLVCAHISSNISQLNMKKLLLNRATYLNQQNIKVYEI